VGRGGGRLSARPPADIDDSTPQNCSTHNSQGGICRGGEPGNFPVTGSDIPPTGLSENLGGMERGRGGKGEREGWGDHLPYFPPHHTIPSPHWLLPQIPP